MRAGAGGERPGWLVLREGRAPRWGGEIRRHHIFTRLAERTGATVLEGGWSDRELRRVVLGPVAGRLPAALGRRLARGPRPRLAASEKLRESTLRTARALADPAVVAVYDDPAAQAAAIGMTLDRAWEARLIARQRANAAAFRWLVVPTLSFAELVGLDRGRIIAGGNATDTAAIRPGPWPAEPSVGIVSAAAPGRGLELLLDAARRARHDLPGLRLLMWLVAPDEAARVYLERFRSRIADDPLSRISTARYADLSAQLASATALCIAHPPNDYMDVALPVKLFDSMAAGRPLVVTPRTETRAIVEHHRVGVVAGGDTADDLAAAIVALIRDPAQCQAMGAQARTVAEEVFDWRVVGDRIAGDVLAMEGSAGLA